MSVASGKMEIMTDIADLQARLQNATALRKQIADEPERGEFLFPPDHRLHDGKRVFAPDQLARLMQATTTAQQLAVQLDRARKAAAAAA